MTYDSLISTHLDCHEDVHWLNLREGGDPTIGKHGDTLASDQHVRGLDRAVRHGGLQRGVESNGAQL